MDYFLNFSIKFCIPLSYLRTLTINRCLDFQLEGELDCTSDAVVRTYCVQFYSVLAYSESVYDGHFFFSSEYVVRPFYNNEKIQVSSR